MAKAIPQSVSSGARLINFGRQRDFISGINGVASGGNVQINMDCDRRYHRLLFQFVAVNFTGGTSLTATALTGSGTGLKVDVTVAANHTVATIVQHTGNAGAGFVTGDTITFTDATGTGFVGTVTASGGAVTAIAITTNGTPSAIAPGTAASTVKLLVNGINVCDLTAQQEINRALFNYRNSTSPAVLAGNDSPVIGAGQLPINFSEDWRKITRWPEITSWDMAGQRTFQIQIQLNGNLVSPGITGLMEFDYIRNTVAGAVDAISYQAALAAGKAPAQMLNIISRHAFTFQVNAGLNLINTIPFDWPILRMHLQGSIANQVNQFELDQDSNKAEVGFVGTQNNGSQLDQLKEMLNEDGFNVNIFDYSFVADVTQRIQDALKVAAAMKLKVYCLQAQSLTIIQERLQNQYA
jgi:hypothetical protein